MTLRIRSRAVPLTDETRRYAERRLHFALGRFRARVDGVTVRFKDLNGPKGGVDTQCTLEIRLRGLPTIVVESVRENARDAVDRAAERAEQAVFRRVDRALTRSRRPSRAA